MSCGGFQGLGSLGAGDTGFQHDEGDGDVVAGGFQGIVSLLAINIGGVLEDGDSALGKLAVLQTQIDHLFQNLKFSNLILVYKTFLNTVVDVVNHNTLYQKP